MAPDERIAEPTCQQQRRLLLKQVGHEMMLEGVWSRICCTKISWHEAEQLMLQALLIV